MTWEEIQNEIAGMLADGQPLENVIAKLEKQKNEMAKANLLKAMDEIKKGQKSDLCKSCSRQNFCGNGMAEYYCTGYTPCMETRWDIIVPPFTDGQKQLIEMTEKIAEKRGGKICDVDDDITDIKELLNDTIKRIEEPTNYDWLHSLNTEETAEFLFGIAYMCSYCGDESHSSQEKMQQCHFGKCGCQRKDWEMWLKQPHREEQP